VEEDSRRRERQRGSELVGTAELREQGFVNARNLATPQELEAPRKPPQGKKAGEWDDPSDAGGLEA
jgi:hypothetical protein